MMRLLLLLLLLPAIGNAQVRLEMVNPTRYDIDVHLRGHIVWIKAHCVGNVIKLDTLHARETIAIGWLDKYRHRYVGEPYIHTSSITSGEWRMFLYRDHIDTNRWNTVVIPKTGVQ